MKVLVLNGANLNMLGRRDANVYGKVSFEDIKEALIKEFTSVSFVFFQSNIEGELVNEIQNASINFDGIIINPGGYAHTSVAIRDALDECKLPKIEVHLSHLVNREEFRQTLLTASACDGYISGFKEYSYMAGIYLLLKLIKQKS